MTHNEIASSIRNRVADGLSGNIADQAFSVEQLKDEIDLVRADLAHKYITNFKLDHKYLVQEIDILPIICRNLSEDCQIKEPCGDLPSIKIPKIMPTFGDKSIEYLGLVNMQESFMVYFDPEDIKNHRVKIKTRHRPFAWVDLAPDNFDMQTIYFFNLGKYNSLKFVKLRAIFEHPGKVNIDKPAPFDIEYPAPLYMQNMIIDTLTEKYVHYYRKLNIPSLPNQQTDQVT
jgi:hypothetical protein